MKKVLKKIRYAFTIAILLSLPSLVSASNVYIDTNHSEFYEGDSVIFSVRVDSQTKNINTVEGNILLNYSPESASIGKLSLSESDLSLWPQKPTLSEDFKIISFSGGIPKGLNSADAVVFKIVLNLKKAGQITLSPSDVSVYLNDGKGTEDETTSKSLTVSVLPRKPDSQPADEWSNQVLSDKTPPEPFEIFMGQDGSVFEGKKFLSWNAIDKQSGISYYEVIEGDLPPVRSDRTYILKEQDKPIKVTIIAYDASGNTRKSVHDPANSTLFNLILAAAFIKFLILIYKGIKR
jgi:hypothetical protein